MSEESSEYDGPASQARLPIRAEVLRKGVLHLYCLYDDQEFHDWSDFRDHAEREHWWPAAEMYLNPPDMAAAREVRRRYQSIMGTPSEGGAQLSQQMNREGL